MKESRQAPTFSKAAVILFVTVLCNAIVSVTLLNSIVVIMILLCIVCYIVLCCIYAYMYIYECYVYVMVMYSYVYNNQNAYVHAYLVTYFKQCLRNTAILWI